jgi:hypothetical protein
VILYHYPKTDRLEGLPSDWAPSEIEEHQDVDNEDDEMRQDSGNSLSTWIAIFNVVVTFGGFLYFGGQLAQRVTTTEENIKERKTARSEDVKSNATNNAQLAVVVSQMTYMQAQMSQVNANIQTVNQKLPDRR